MDFELGFSNATSVAQIAPKRYASHGTLHDGGWTGAIHGWHLVQGPLERLSGLGRPEDSGSSWRSKGGRGAQEPGTHHLGTAMRGEWSEQCASNKADSK